MYEKKLQEWLDARGLELSEPRFVGSQRIHPRRNAERRLTKAIGSRQARRQAKAERLAKREEKLYRLHDEAIQVRFEEARHED